MKNRSLKHLGFNSLIERFKSIIQEVKDSRLAVRRQFELSDLVLSAFGCMYSQEPSLLSFQRTMQEEERRNNLCSMFRVQEIPKDTQMREVLDQFPSSKFEEVFNDYFLRLQRGKHLEQYRFLQGSYLVTMDGTQFFCSEKLLCGKCLEAKDKDGNVQRHSHQALQLAVVHPDLKQVIPLMPEEIANTDGSTKQDCEINAAKRSITRLRTNHPQLDITLVADGLFSKQPMIEHARDKRMHFIFVAKPTDHKYLFEQLTSSGKLLEKNVVKDGKTFVYRWATDVLLNARKDAISVNYFSIDIINDDKITYRNSWVTDHEVSKQSVEKLVAAGRARWKIENECFNTLKNQGYNLEHNYGHGEQNLCFNFYLLILLSFLYHQIFELTDEIYQTCIRRQTKKEFWIEIRYLLKQVFFESWDTLMRFLFTKEKLIPLSRSP